ncbi:WAS protein family like protein 1 [Sarcoptes scabiei]|nr:WAS protein family like protein 1 [Sarcoptes scabiei]
MSAQNESFNENYEHFVEREDDNDIPEEISTKSSKLEAKNLFADEKNAKKISQERMKEKRRQQIAKNAEQKQKRIRLKRLPANLLNEIDSLTKIDGPKSNQSKCDRKNDTSNKKEKVKIKSKIGKSEKIIANEWSNYKVLDLDQLKNTSIPIVQSKINNFRERILYDRNRNRRIMSRQMMANRSKRKAWRR